MNRDNYWWLSPTMLVCELVGALCCFIVRGGRILGAGRPTGCWGHSHHTPTRFGTSWHLLARCCVCHCGAVMHST